MNSTKYTFYGDQREPPIRYPDSPVNLEPYVASPDLVQAINLAMFLNRPLLLEGEAGSGKTRLARAVACELGLPLYQWHVRSTSKAQDGLYTYDAILRLHDVQLSQLGLKADDVELHARDPRDPAHYRRLGPLGKSFVHSSTPAVVLIDEIDKADVDFPNDLLTVLDEPWAFEIPETGEKIEAIHKPIVIITSNKEKGNLPAPFLRRCVYFFIEFPESEKRLREIVAIHYSNKQKTLPSDKLLGEATKRFLDLRREGGLIKKPGTSEYLDWIEALSNFQQSPVKPEVIKEKRLIYPELLLKLRADWQHLALATN